MTPPVNPWYTLPTNDRYLAYIDTVDNLPETPAYQPCTLRIGPTDPPINIPLESSEDLPDPRLTIGTHQPQNEPPTDPIIAPENQAISAERQDTDVPSYLPVSTSVLSSEDEELLAFLTDQTSELIETVPQPNSLPENQAISAERPTTPSPVIHLIEHPDQDIVHLEIDDWLTIDETGLTEDISSLIPPEELQLEFQFEDGYSLLEDLLNNE